MAVRKYRIEQDKAGIIDPVLRDVDNSAPHAPVASPALALQSALRDAGFETIGTRNQRRLGRMMLALTMLCVYAIAMLMMTGPLSA